MQKRYVCPGVSVQLLPHTCTTTVCSHRERKNADGSASFPVGGGFPDAGRVSGRRPGSLSFFLRDVSDRTVLSSFQTASPSPLSFLFFSSFFQVEERAFRPSSFFFFSFVSVSFFIGFFFFFLFFVRLRRVLERIARSQSNVLQTLHHSFNFYFYAKSDRHVSSGFFFYPLLAMLAALIIPVRNFLLFFLFF